MNDRDIAEYLIAHPDFFERHAELLAGVRLTSPHGQRAVSLQERQIEMQREKTKQIERRLAELMRYGHENDDISAKLHRWTLGLLSERDPHALPDAIARGLRDVFDVPFAAVRLWNVATPYQPADFARSVSEEVKIFASSLATPYCGANTGFEAVTWLGASSDPASVALLALRDPQMPDGPIFGLLVMGSEDARRFHEGMATDFLTQIGELAGAALGKLRADD
ncbi:hypothetical protein PCO31110_00780 [Pandoraea communis]|uniref:DUF484 family protein n=1 Tax=Pandoraea communis TaxID=2508297 RepID=A0A5E4SJA0_9BURK|nr:DUF484 family protein [Pandoraea communis]VVD74308.1 hypothetical protein PCO31110_00780 [Pandoraea communis]